MTPLYEKDGFIICFEAKGAKEALELFGKGRAP